VSLVAFRTVGTPGFALSRGARATVAYMVDTKQTKTIGEHHVASVLARRGWAPALTRDGIARTDILAVNTRDETRLIAEIQVKTARSQKWEWISWLLGTNSQKTGDSGHEFFALVAVLDDLEVAPRDFVVPRTHVAAAAWIDHMHWLTDPTVEQGKRNVGPDRARTRIDIFTAYEDRWDLLDLPESGAPILLPHDMHAWALEDGVGLPPGHPWAATLPDW
jgi:hypothetical protein